jgi:hypothetical protein
MAGPITCTSSSATLPLCPSRGLFNGFKSEAAALCEQDGSPRFRAGSGEFTSGVRATLQSLAAGRRLTQSSLHKGHGGSHAADDGRRVSQQPYWACGGKRLNVIK